MLTGTPLQNNLEELFNLMLFLTKQSSSLQRFPSIAFMLTYADVCWRMLMYADVC